MSSAGFPAGMADFSSAPVRVRVPATSGNLGPGFDAMGVAVDLYDEVSARVTEGGVAVQVTGEGAGQLPADERHLVVRSANTAFDLLGGRPPGLALTCHNRIPHARGLGSSSAAIVAGLLLARALTPGGERKLDDDAVYRLASELEGHPDNAAPCVYGGLTIAWLENAGARVVRLEPADLRLVALIPDERSLTRESRQLLPAQVPHADAALNAARAALLVHAMTAAPELLMPATEDRLHQEYRAPSMPNSMELVRRLRATGVPTVLSGAGSAVLAFVAAGQELPDQVFEDLGTKFRVLPLRVDRAGATVFPAKR